MALDGDAMGTAAAAAVKAAAPAPGTPMSDAQLEAVWKAACGAIVAHLKSNGVITPDTFQIINPENSAPVSVTGTGKIT
jgi:hypothetical protein